MEITKRRGGEAEAGSCLWADLDEHKKSKSFNGIYQVFGHTQQKKKAVKLVPIITPPSPKQ